MIGLRPRAALLAAALAGGAGAEPYVPANDAEVLERLPLATAERAALGKLRRRLAARPDDLDLAVDAAWRLVAAARRSGDPRYAGYAEAALRPWWSQPAPPPVVLLLRATIHQNRHRFASAIADLRALVAREPGNARAWLTLSVVQSVMGRPHAAAQSCRALVRLAHPLAAAACQAHAASLAGEAARAYRHLDRALGAGLGKAAMRAWAHGVLAEIAVRLGRHPAAERHFRAALALTPEDRYLRHAWADLCLDLERPADAIAALGADRESDGALLRLALAARMSGAADAGALAARLARRHEALARRGDSTHLAEVARLQLLLGAPRRSLELARRNWEQQREPRDARVLLEAAVAAGEAGAAGPVLSWMARTGVEDVRLDRLAARLVT